MGSKKSVKLTGHTYACKSLTSFKFEVYPLLREMETCNDMTCNKDSFDHSGSVSCHSESSEVPYSPNQ